MSFKDDLPKVLNIAVLKGRIDSARQYNGKFYTQITSPAVDAYSQPSRFELRSNTNLGSQGQEVELKVQLSGYIRNFKYTDKASGQQRDGSECSVYLDVV